MNQRQLNTLILIALGLWLLYTLAGLATPRESGWGSITYSAFIDKVRAGQVSEVVIDDGRIRGRYNDGTRFETFDPGDRALVDELLQNQVKIVATPPEKPSLLAQIFISWFPFLLLIGVWIWFLRRSGAGGGPGGLFNFGKSRAKLLAEDQIKITFADVAGVEEAKDEVKELVEFLRNPQKFSGLGGKIPKGVLMVGSPGTGKTLLARAIAGEARVPFFSISGSDFVEMFVGVGASRVRDLFEQAKKRAPCIIFIDEIDAVGRRRGAGLGGGHDEREQTLNQMLVEMDGFEGNEGIIVIAATNRPDVLDPALLRPGRFDRQVVVPLPDILGREHILKVHSRKMPLAEGVDLQVIARGTPGFSGADLANLVNEAALFAARANLQHVTMEMFERAKDKIMMGAERRSMVMSEDEKRLTAYHESGHTIVGLLVPSHDPVHKVSIIPRGRALGVTLFLPERDRFNASREQLESQISTLFGGRLAEELIFGTERVTTGAQNDIHRATDIARNMVTRWGLSDQLGPLAYHDDEGEVFLGHSVTRHKNVADGTAKAIDQEVRGIIDRNYQRAKALLTKNLDKLHTMAAALMQYETLDKGQIADIMAGRPMRPPEGGSATPPPPPSPTGSAPTGDRGARGGSSVGGPAGQHFIGTDLR